MAMNFTRSLKALFTRQQAAELCEPLPPEQQRACSMEVVRRLAAEEKATERDLAESLKALETALAHKTGAHP